MNTFLEKIKKTLTGTCVINTILITLLYILGYITNSSGGTAWIPKFNIMWMVLGVSFVISLAERILEMKGSFALKLICHFGLCVAGFLLVFIVCGGYGNKSGSIVIGTFLFVLAYIIVNGIRFAVTGRFKNLGKAEDDYEPMFGKKENK